MLKWFAGGLVLPVLLVGSAQAACPSFPYSFTNGSTADASQVNADFANVITCFAPIANPLFTGSVGIGVTTPATQLDVNGSIGAGSYAADVHGALYYDVAGGAFAIEAHNAANSVKKNLSLAAYGGNVGIGTNAPSYLLHVNGTAYSTAAIIGGLGGTGNRAVYSDASGNLTNSSSDARMKEKIAPLGYGLKEVEALRPVSFNWRANLQSRYGQQREIGLLAQDVRKVVPEVVGENHDGTLSVDYAKLVAVLTAALQEQQAEIEQLRSEIATLKAAH
jgi:hypothetical protein